MVQNPIKVLFVDDDVRFLELVQSLMAEYAGPAWEIFVTADTAQALALLQAHQIDLLVTDVHMPVVDGLQFLKLVQRKYRDLLKIVLTGDTTGAYRAACLSSGADLFIEKPRAMGGWQAIYANLSELVRFRPQEGFRGVLKKVGLQDILQLECLARSSSVLELSAGDVRGTIFIHEGQIVHAQVGERSGEEAFYELMALVGGEFSLRPYAEPHTRSIGGSWEFLVMEAARKRDEAAPSPELAAGRGGESPLEPAPSLRDLLGGVTAPPAPGAGSPRDAGRPQIDEMLVCSPQGEILYEWQCANTSARIDFLEFLSQKSRQISNGLALGHFDRLEARTPSVRVVTRIQPEHALFVRSSIVPLSSATPG